MGEDVVEDAKVVGDGAGRGAGGRGEEERHQEAGAARRQEDLRRAVEGDDGRVLVPEEEDEVLCPACGDADDRTSMIACDLCDKWSVLVLSFIWCFS